MTFIWQTEKSHFIPSHSCLATITAENVMTWLLIIRHVVPRYWQHSQQKPAWSGKLTYCQPFLSWSKQATKHHHAIVMHKCYRQYPRCTTYKKIDISLKELFGLKMFKCLGTTYRAYVCQQLTKNVTVKSVDVPLTS